MKAIKTGIAGCLHGYLKEMGIRREEDELYRLIEIPPDSELGDFSFPVFTLARELRQNPAGISAAIAAQMALPPYISRMASVGGYVNFFADRKGFGEYVLSEIIRQGRDYGRSRQGEGKTVVIDFCAANIAKPFHMGHLPTTVIGGSLCHIYRFLGYRVVGINHLGDWGTQFGKLITAYKKWGDSEKIEKNPIKELVAIYVRFHEEAEKDDSLNDQARAAFKALEDGKEENVRLWQWFRKVSIDEFKRILELLNIAFDSWDGESFYTDKMEPVVEELDNKGLLVESEGARIVDLAQYAMPPCLILRRDGATLYATRDLAALLYRSQNYRFHKALYCVGVHQELHFRQVFKVAELLGYARGESLVHVANGVISLESGSMGTRKGSVIYLEEVLKEAVSKAAHIIEDKNPQLEDKEDVARMVGVGAVKFSALKNKRTKDSVFVWEKVLNFEGETSCYIQYTYARISSLLRKAPDQWNEGKKADFLSGGEDVVTPDYEGLSDNGSFEVVKLLSRFPQAVMDAGEQYEPSMIAGYLLDLCQGYNRFYHEKPILKETDAAVRDARLLLSAAVKNVVGTGMALLGIECPESM